MVVVGAIAVGALFLMSGKGPAPMQSGVKTGVDAVKNLVNQAAQSLVQSSPQPAQTPPAAEKKPAAPPKKRAAKSSSAPAVAMATKEPAAPIGGQATSGRRASALHPVPQTPALALAFAPSPAGTTAPAVGTAIGVTPPPAAAPAPEPESAKPHSTGSSVYLPGPLMSWMPVNLALDGPLLVRAGGEISTGEDISGPAGLSDSNFDRALARNDLPASGHARIVSGAPYLALIGRMCSRQNCSEPFLIGARNVICPEGNPGGQLQLWTNNYVQIGGKQTLSNFSSVTGGYWVYTEPGPAAACGAHPSATSLASDEAVLAAGQVLRRPDFAVSASQVSWKPFFLPMGKALVVRASGTMKPRGGTMSTGPEGINVPGGAEWHYPGTRTVVVDREHGLFDPALPYQALIGRLCSAAQCGPAFLVGRNHAVCPTSSLDDRLELWVNHIIGPRSDLGKQTPLTMDAFDLQQRTGEYRFEIEQAPPGACSGITGAAAARIR